MKIIEPMLGEQVLLEFRENKDREALADLREFLSPSIFQAHLAVKAAVRHLVLLESPNRWPQQRIRNR
jgi:hypothetical protein